MKGLLVVNEFLHLTKFDEIHNLLQVAFLKEGIALELKTNAQIVVEVDSDALFAYDFVLFWDKDIMLAKHLENKGLKVFNSASAIDICDDKQKTAIFLENYNIKMPKTIFAPFTYENIGYTNSNFLQNVAQTLGFPLVVKEAKGSFGKQVYLVDNMQDLCVKIAEIGAKPILFQQFIKSSFGIDTRIQVVGGKVVATVKRIGKEGDFRANVTNGGKMVAFKPSKEFEQMALYVCQILCVDFAGVDILFGANNEPIFCEINSNAHFKNILDATGINVADCLAQYIKGKIAL
ncbi:MAG: RimK family alpha-L-glutamate ligase [Clostridia bacterium]